MPNKPQSHSERERKRMGRTLLGKEYEAKRRQDPALAEAARLRSSARWRRLRKMKLARNPLCEECSKHGVVEPATQVDHIVPIVERRDLAFDLENLQSLCTVCHGKKSGEERRRSC